MNKKKIKKRKKKEKIKHKKILSKKLVSQKTFKTADEKVVIKKIKKQATEKRIYNIKDFVVYPKHGVGEIVGVEKAKIGEIEINFYKVFIK